MASWVGCCVGGGSTVSVGVWVRTNRWLRVWLRRGVRGAPVVRSRVPCAVSVMVSESVGVCGCAAVVVVEGGWIFCLPVECVGSSSTERKSQYGTSAAGLPKAGKEVFNVAI